MAELEIRLRKAFRDNYVRLLRDSETGATAAGGCLALEERTHSPATSPIRSGARAPSSAATPVATFADIRRRKDVL